MKIIKKISKRIIAISLVFAFMLMCIEPLTSVQALNTYSVVITVEVDDDSDVTLSINHGQDGDELFGTRNGVGNAIGFEDSGDRGVKYTGDSISINCENDKRCTVTITVPNEHGVFAVLGGDTPFTFSDYNSENITENRGLTIVNRELEKEFDGNAYLIWSCGGGTCYHLFEDTKGKTLFIAESTITADNNQNEVFDVHADYKTFASKDDFDEWQEAYKEYKNLEEIDFSKLDTSVVIEHVDMREYEEDAIKDGACTRENMVREEFEACVDEYVEAKGIFNKRAGFQPVGEPYSNNAYVSYGDRNFKITIYNKDYRGVTLGSLDDLSYYPAVWNNPFLRIESFDISDTDMDNATIIETILLESTVNIKALRYNDFEIKSIDALDVPEGAVTVNKVNGEFKIKFASNFYDSVVFKVTSTDNKVHYFRINRLTIDAGLRHDDHKAFISSYFYFDNKTSYEDYIIKCKIVYKDGTFKNVEMENAKKIDNGLGDLTYAYELDEENSNSEEKGKGLKVAAYQYEISEKDEKNISKVYVNVEYKGSTKDTYAGAFAGSGKGVLIDFEEEFR